MLGVALAALIVICHPSAHAAGPSKEDSASADEEIIRERLVRQARMEQGTIMQSVM